MSPHQAAVQGHKGRHKELGAEGLVADRFVARAVLGQPLLDEPGLLDRVVKIAVDAGLLAVDGQAAQHVAAQPVPAMVVLWIGGAATGYAQATALRCPLASGPLLPLPRPCG